MRACMSEQEANMLALRKMRLRVPPPDLERLVIAALLLGALGVIACCH